MTKLEIKGTEDTPDILFDSGELTFSGRSLPEDVTSFYEPVMNWIEDFEKSPVDLNINFKLEYFNTASSKIILDILLKFEEIFNDSDLSVKVIWYSQSGDDDMKEAGEEYSEIVEVKFEYIEY